MAKPSGIPAWGGGSGSRMAPTAAAAKLRTVKDKERARSASSASFRPDDRPGGAASSSGGWGFFMAPEPLEEEGCPAVTPSTTPVKTESRPAAMAPDGDVTIPVPMFDRASSPAASSRTAPTNLPTDAQAALQALAGALSSAAQGNTVAGLQGSSWETAFLAGVAVGLRMLSAVRQRSAAQSVLLAVALVCALLVLGGSALLVAGVAEAHPTVYYT